MSATNDTRGSSSLATDAQPDGVHAVAIKLPPFCVEDPISWFDHAGRSAKPGIRHIATDECCYWYIMSLHAETSSCTTHALSSVAAGNCYDQLKTFLMSPFSPSVHQREEKLLGLSKLGDCSLMQFADCMWRTFGDHYPAILLQQIFRRSLPTYVQDALT